MIVDELHNIAAYCPPNLFDPTTGEPMTRDVLERTFPPSMAAVELSRERRLPIPGPLVDSLAGFRPTPLFRATAWERALGTSCRIFVKDEGCTPSGNHKMNSALYVAYLCSADGAEVLVTETTGNWGIALAMAASQFGLRTICFMDADSARERPDRKHLMEEAGASVSVVEHDDLHNDLLALSADAAISFTKGLPGATYIFGSVYNYFIAPQTLVGAEAMRQMADDRPDIVVGSCGGGANLLGTASAFIADSIETGRPVRIFSAESEHCPILTKGRAGMFSIDEQGYYPMTKTYGLDGLGASEYIGGLGSTIVAGAAAHFHTSGLIEARAFTSAEATAAARSFAAAEGHQVALETTYQLAAVSHLAATERDRTILVNVSSRGQRSTFA